MIETGFHDRLGASCERDGVNFAIWSAAADDVELCLFDTSGNQTHAHTLPACTDGIWHGFVPGIADGQIYGFRVHGDYEPEQGLRCNPARLVIDPYARELCGELHWNAAVFDYVRASRKTGLVRSDADSAPFVPKCVVRAAAGAPACRPDIPWAETIIYELNVRGYTMLHPSVAEADRGTFRGLRQREVLDYLRALGVTSVELMPVHAFVDEEFLVKRGLRNYWGYNTLGFFAPAGRLLGGGAIAEFREMVDAIHDAGIEVILDVVYNHTAEGGRLGPTLSFRGIDNRAYYRLLPDEPGEYINDTGCGNTINTDHPVVRRLILDSLRYWVEAMGVDGFRFDLAVTLGRTGKGFDAGHELFGEIGNDSVLSGVKLIAEPWDVGPHGYQLGGFPSGWAEWNDRYRDAARQFWRGDADIAPEFARRVHGSSDLFEGSGRGPSSSINFVTSHDGFTLADLVSYAERHNEANGEDNQDGHVHNLSTNHGTEGATDDAEVLAARRQHRFALLTALLCAQGTPMILAGDEFGNSQNGNNNAYCQDNAVGWLDWAAARSDPQFTESVRTLIQLRRAQPLLRQAQYRHGEYLDDFDQDDIVWFGADGRPLSDSEWHVTRTLGLLLHDGDGLGPGETAACAVLLNASNEPRLFAMPDVALGGHWYLEFDSSGAQPGPLDQGAATLARRSAACLSFRLHSGYS